MERVNDPENLLYLFDVIQGNSIREGRFGNTRTTFETPKYPRWPRDQYTSPNSEY